MEKDILFEYKSALYGYLYDLEQEKKQFSYKEIKRRFGMDEVATTIIFKMLKMDGLIREDEDGDLCLIIGEKIQHG